jgi:hypothetical protein
MKIPTLLFLAVFGLADHAFSQAPIGPGSVKLGKIAIEGQKTPEFNLSLGPTKRTGKSLTWLEIEVDYDTMPKEIDELTFKFSALIEKQLITGEVTYVNIAEGKGHYAVMYVSPKGLDKLTKGKPFTAASVENAWVEVTRQGQQLSKPVSLKNGNVPNVPQMSGLLLNKNQTPFAPLFYDRYEEIKPK